MALAVENSQAFIGKQEASYKDEAPAMSRGWYILRFRVLTAKTKLLLSACPYEVFFPYKYTKKKNHKTGGYDYVKTPIMNGYIFVCAILKDVLELSQELDLPIWVRKDPLLVQGSQSLYIKQYYSVSDEDMRWFMQAVELKNQNIEVYDATCIDLQKDDEVVIKDGLFKGVRGYLKTSQGKDGGVVVVPLNAKQGRYKRSVLACGIPAKVSEIGVLRFAKGNRHASDIMRSATKVVDKAMREYAAGNALPVVLVDQMMSYLHRFEEAKWATDIQRGNHLLLLYRIHTILDNTTSRELIGQQIRHEVIPAFDERIQDAQHRGRPDGHDKKEQYLALMAKADEARDQRIEALSKRANTGPTGWS